MVTWNGDNQSAKTTLLSRGCHPSGQVFPSKYHLTRTREINAGYHRSVGGSPERAGFPFPHICIGDTW